MKEGKKKFSGGKKSSKSCGSYDNET